MPSLAWWQLALAFSAPIVVLGSIAMWFVRATVKMAIQQSNTEQIDHLKGVYIPAMESNLTGAEIQRLLAETKSDLITIRRDTAELATYAHAKIHDLANVLQVQLLQQQLEKLKTEVNK
jgi:hypothetical protein